MSVHLIKNGWHETACGREQSGALAVTSLASAVECGLCKKAMAADYLGRFVRAWHAIDSGEVRRLYWMRAGIGPNDARKFAKMSCKRWPVKVASLMRRQMLSNPDCARLLGEAVSPIVRGGEHDRRGQVQEAWRVDQLGPRCRLCGC